ncbi:hypothetical protein ABEB36_003347 [Hypothenemus hampei]|uniref:Ubiquitin-like domain-containing protein n=1 Tax=Hypothenemus hampei TaxID=57062 RepID=A0ABD1FCH2_HYPHA
MILRIKPFIGEERVVEIESTDQIQTVKEKLQEIEGTSVDQQRLIYKGKHLKNDKTIEKSIYRRWLLQRYQDLALPHELVSLLKSLRKKFQIALITNGTSASQWEKIERLELKHCFDLILVSGDLSYEKPDKNIFFQACQLLNVDPKRCLMVGDKLETDILGGLEAGLAGTAWLRLNSHYNLSESDPKPSYILRNVMELKHLLSKNNNEFEGKLLYKNQKDKSRMYNEDLRCEDESANDSFADYEHKTLKYLKMFHLEEDSNSNASDGS